MNIYLKRSISTFLGWNFYTFLKMLTYEWDHCKTEGPLPYSEVCTVVREGVITMSIIETVGSVKFIFVIVTEISIMNIVSP